METDITKSMNPAQLMIHQLRVINSIKDYYPQQNNILFHSRLRNYRHRFKLTFVELAEFTETDLTTVRRWYYKEYKPNEESYDRVMKILDIADGIV